MIDLHTHTNESDGTYSPAELIQEAIDLGLEALAITDHDTFAGYDAAAPAARAQGLDVICGIELSAKMQTGDSRVKTVHVLGYFLCGPPSTEFRAWLMELQAGRRERNVRLVAKLNSMNVNITLEEVERLGRSLAGRPHFAKILVKKGYAKTIEQAFRDFIGEDAPGYVERDAPHVATSMQRIIAGGGMPVVAHPIRLGYRDRQQEEDAIGAMRDAGLEGIEVYHSDQGVTDSNRYLALARKYDLAVTGGSDFHGAVKPNVKLGSGVHGNVQVPKQVIDNLRRRCG
ncbi:MAG: PHP domain-containing protein [Acidobacteriaceae bacterium]|nr:PHP domain-containing protein [Acidobacteriaceae bacterium]